MTGPSSCYLWWLATLVLCFCCQQCNGWRSAEPPQKKLLPPPRWQWQEKVSQVMAAAMISTTITLFTPPPIINNLSPLLPTSAVPAAVAMESSSPLSNMDEQQLRQSLKPPTADRPQIMLPSGGAEVPIEKRPIVEGLLSLSNPQKRPVPTDTIVITVRSFDHPETVLGGARVPVTKAKFPLAFRLFPKNLLKDKVEEWETAKQGDLLVQAVVCPEDLPNCTPSLQGEGERGGGARMQAKGVAKLIRNLPGQLQDQTIRGPVALPLQ